MRRVWLNKKNTDRVVLFFHGWGADEHLVEHVSGSDDLLMFYDYRDILEEGIPDLQAYQEVYVVAWSMGVWAAAVLLSKWGITPKRAIAINGTEHPIDDFLGIPLKIYLLTERGMDERGREKFFARMFDKKEERERFLQHRPLRLLEEQVEELKSIRLQAGQHSTTMVWNRVYISDKDVIFPVENQLRWWKGRAVICRLVGGHYPFYELESWNRIVEYVD